MVYVACTDEAIEPCALLRPLHEIAKALVVEVEIEIPETAHFAITLVSANFDDALRFARMTRNRIERLFSSAPSSGLGFGIAVVNDTQGNPTARHRKAKERAQGVAMSNSAGIRWAELDQPG